MKDSLLSKIGYLSPEDRKWVERALDRAIALHGDQIRDTGEPYVTHPIAVASYLAGLEAGATTLIAALLHDVVEDNHATIPQLAQEFGPDISRLVDAVTKLSRLQYQGRRDQRQIASLRKLLLTAQNDLRVIFIKLADRWHNVETLSGIRSDKMLRVAMETLDIYVPFARLVGLWDLKSRMEEVCFPVAFPEESRLWHEKIAEARVHGDSERRSFVGRINAETTDDVHAQLVHMTDYEIYQKLQGNLHRLDNPENLDTVLIRILRTDAKPLDCYRVLGEVHTRYPSSSFFFRDYINAPQPNGYRALHTTIFLTRSHRLRLRIQTQSMYEYASLRKLSSWVGDHASEVTQVLGALHRAHFEEQQFLSDLRETVLKERINVFTTSGDVITLPHRATGVDFAFALNPDHLGYLMAVRVNGELREATYALNEGDMVELVLNKNGSNMPQTLWIEKVKSVEAREELRSAMRRTPADERRENGLRIFLQELQKRRLPQWWLLHLNHMQRQLALNLQQPSFDNVLENIGAGILSVGIVVDEYRRILAIPTTWTLRFLEFLHLLPRSRVLDKSSTLIDIEVTAEDRKGLIHDITGCFVDRDINIAKFGVFAVPPRDALYKIRLEAKNFDQFSDLFDAMLLIPSVKQVLRKK